MFFPDDVRAVKLLPETVPKFMDSGCSNRGGDRIESNVDVVGRMSRESRSGFVSGSRLLSAGMTKGEEISVGTIGLRRNFDTPKVIGVVGFSCEVSLEITLTSSSSNDCVLDGGDEMISTSKISLSYCGNTVLLSVARRVGESKVNYDVDQVPYQQVDCLKVVED